MKKEVRIAHLETTRHPDKGEAGSAADKTQPLQTEAIMPNSIGSFGSL